MPSRNAYLKNAYPSPILAFYAHVRYQPSVDVTVAEVVDATDLKSVSIHRVPVRFR